MKTYSAKPKDIKRKWYIVDAKGKILGRLATKVAFVLRGKHKPTFTPHLDCGDGVIVINAKQIVLSGDKLKKKIHYHHSLYPGGLKSEDYETFLKKKPEKVIEKAVKGMLPHNKLGQAMLKKLKVYKDAEHLHQAQKPEELESILDI